MLQQAAVNIQAIRNLAAPFFAEPLAAILKRFPHGIGI